MPLPKTLPMIYLFFKFLVYMCVTSIPSFYVLIRPFDFSRRWWADGAVGVGASLPFHCTFVVAVEISYQVLTILKTNLLKPYPIILSRCSSTPIIFIGVATSDSITTLNFLCEWLESYPRQGWPTTICYLGVALFSQAHASIFLVVISERGGHIGVLRSQIDNEEEKQTKALCLQLE